MLEGAPSTLPLNRSSTFGSTLQGWEDQPLCQLLALGEVRMLRHHHQKWHAICMVLRLLRPKKSHIQRNLSFPESHCCVIHAAVLGALSIIAFRYVYIYKYIYIYISIKFILWSFTPNSKYIQWSQNVQPNPVMENGLLQPTTGNKHQHNSKSCRCRMFTPFSV